MAMRILTPQQDQLLQQERSALNDLRAFLAEFGIDPQDQITLRDSIQQLDDLFLLVIVGEFNAGKSAFINALLGDRLLKEGVTPTTTQINVLRHGEANQREVTSEHLHILTLPAAILEEISIVDTPGTNAIIREHEAITSEFVPRSDLVLFITSADRPFTESERAFMQQIRDWGKKVVIVINKIDILQTPEDLRQVIDFVRENATSLLGSTPEIFPVSARQALRGKTGEPDLWPESRFEALETFIRETLDEAGRLRLKFLNPLGVGSHLVNRYLEIVTSRQSLLKDDFTMLGDVDAQLTLYREDMARDFQYRLADIENILFEMEQRGQDFFDNTFRIARIFDLLGRDRVQQEFEHEVVADAPQRIERKVNELIDWLVESDLRQWQAVNDHLAERRREHQPRIVGDTAVGSFHYDRDRLMEALGREAQRAIETFDKERLSEEMADGAQMAVATSLAVEAGALGLGTLVAVLATTAAADVTGILMASVLAALGLFILPARRRQAKEELRERIANLRTRLMTALRGQFEKEIERSLRHINDAISPYTRFVRSEQGKLEDARTRLEGLRITLEGLRVRIEELIAPSNQPSPQ